MDGQWHIRQQLELLSSPTTVHCHRIDTYSSLVEGVRRVRKVLTGDWQAENDKLIRACCRNDLETVKCLLDNDEIYAGALKKGINRSALHEAALHHDGGTLARLLCQHGADPKQRDSLGRTALHYAASYGHLDVVIELMHFTPVEISTLVDREGRCPLMYACGEGHLSLCQWLIEHGEADYCRQDDHGRSCLTYACRNGHVETVEWLLCIVSPEATKTGWHPLHLACSVGHVEVMKLLLKYDEQSGNALTNTNHSVLFMAMHSTTSSVEMVKYLLDAHPTIQLTMHDVEDLNCDKSLVLLLAQRRHALDYLFRLLERIDYYFPLLHLLLLSEHAYSRQQLLSVARQQAFIHHRLRNPLRLKEILRCVIRRSSNASNQIDLLEISLSLKKFIRFEYL